MKARFKEMFAHDNLRKASCPGCGKWLLISPDGPITREAAHSCSCGAVYCPDCYRDRLRGYFGEEMSSLPTYALPLAAVGYYLVNYEPTLEYLGLILGGSVLGGLLLKHQLYLPLSRILRLAKECRLCGGRTFADWRSVAIVEPDAGEEDAQPDPDPGPTARTRRRLVDELDPT